MEYLNRISSRNKIIIGFSAIIIGIIIALIIILFNLNHIMTSKKSLDTALRSVNELTQIRAHQNRINALLLSVILEKDATESAAHIEEYAILWKDVDEILIELEIDLQINQDALMKFKALVPFINDLKKQHDRFLEINKDGQSDAAQFFFKQEVRPYSEDLRQKIFELQRVISTYTEDLFVQTNATISSSYNSMMVIGLILIVIISIIIIGIFRMIARISRDIKEGVAVLGTSSAEIQTTVAEVATGAAETATAISETTTTVEEIRQTSIVSGQKAKNLLESSQKASDAGEQGLDSSAMMVEAMRKIDTQMKVIQSTITKLAEQNRSIGEITSTVADIADQSNLLAVNAAIEAAKAGEHGRGFSVVAQEIRSLSEQSKKSTTQVKDILNEIQKSVSLAVEVINQGMRTVEDGGKTVTEDRIIVETLIDSISEAAEAAIQIKSSSQQQIAGMDQIVPAMENIRQASEQNVAGIRQTQQALKDLQQLGEDLKKVILRYKL
ncbi:MAG: methyl-accepting chemotaxis protein [Bacteroidales bacterium]|nr:methyl-accepting chemotaxis protein [Bacteroidales bacterium]